MQAAEQVTAADPNDLLCDEARICLSNTDGDWEDAFSKCTKYLDELESDTLAISKFQELGILRVRAIACAKKCRSKPKKAWKRRLWGIDYSRALDKRGMRS